MSSRAVPEPVFLLDASVTIFRYYFSMPDAWWSDDGRPTAAVYGYSRWLVQLLSRHQPTRIAACFDESLGTCFRNQLFPAYKASRVLPDDDLAFQLRACREMTESLGIATYASYTHEADDLIGTLAARAHRQGRPVRIISRDKDLLQLLRPGDQLWDATPEGQVRDWASVTALFGIDSAQIPDYLALIGDPCDDIPGVPGVGPKTAVALLREFGSIPNLLAHLDQLSHLPLRGAAGLSGKLRDHSDQLMLMRQLTRIDRRARLGRRMQLLRARPRLAAVLELANFLGFGSELQKALSPSIS